MKNRANSIGFLVKNDGFERKNCLKYGLTGPLGCRFFQK
jgi:hypothetical protein